MKNILRILIILISFTNFLSFELIAQTKSKVELLHSDRIKFDKFYKGGAQRIIGNVKFRQDSTIMECDSAYMFKEKNVFEAYSNVSLYKMGNSDVSVKSDFLRHNGNLKMAHFRNNVVLRDSQVVLTTDSLDFDIQGSVGYYLYGGNVIDSATTLTSTKGYYHSKINTVFFKDNVVVNHNEGEYQMFTDTLKYNTINKTAFFYGPTRMYNDTNYMYAEHGWYDTQYDKSFFKKNALYTNPKQSIEADSLFYNKETNHGIAYSNVVATDTNEQAIVKCNYLEVFKNEDKIIVTDSAILSYVVKEDTLYLHGDTLCLEYDTSGVYRSFKAYHHVKLFKSDFQAKADSLYITLADTILQFHGSPVFWAEGNQLTAGYIEAYIVNEALDKFKLFNTGVIISTDDSLNFNQIKGLEMTGYLKNNEMSHIDIFKKSETIYFPVDKEGIIGVNKSTSKDITIRMKKGKVSRIIYRTSYDGAMYPLEDLLPKDKKIKEFEWLDAWRPTTPEEIFIWEEGEVQESLVKRSGKEKKNKKIIRNKGAKVEPIKK